MLLYFLVNVLQRLVDEFWQSSASREPYNTMCVAAMCKCPPSITSLLVYLRSPYVTQATLRAIPPTSTDRISWSELARAATQVEAPVARGVSSSQTQRTEVFHLVVLFSFAVDV